MGRRTSGAQVGLEKIGSVQANAATLTTTQANTDLTLDPNGTGGVVINGDVTIADQGDLRLREGSGGGTNYIAMQAASTMSANYTITWPSAVSGSSGYVLSSDTSGNLSWTNPASFAASITDPGSSSTVHYPIFATNAGSLPTTLNPNARTTLSFVPSTGELRHAILSGGNSSGGTLTVRGTSDATKATASVLMTDAVASTTTTTGTLVVTGGVGVSGQLTAATLVETSSIAFKENVNPIDNALEIVMQLFGVTYDRKDTGKHEAGLIAEDVYKVVPDLVALDENGKPYGLQYTKLTAYLVESIKSLKSEITKLQEGK